MEELIINRLSQYGFVVLDLLNMEEINYLNTLCGTYLSPGQTDFVASSHVLNKEDSAFINSELHRILDDRFQQQFPDLQLLGGTLATKVKGSSTLVAHQDWTIVDEEKYSSYNLWLALVDTSKENGTLGLVPGSHRWNKSLRGMNISVGFERFTDKFLTIGIEPSLKAGQAILYNHKLIHYSRPNKTVNPRNVAIIGAKDRAAELRVSFSLDEKTIKTYRVSENDFYRFDIEKIVSSNEILSSEPLKTISLSWQDLLSQFKLHVSEEFSYLIPERNSFFSKFFNKF